MNHGDSETPLDDDDRIWRRIVADPMLEEQQLIKTMSFIGEHLLPVLAADPRYGDLSVADILPWFDHHKPLPARRTFS